MNERIRQLVEQAGFIDRGSNHTAYMSFDHEKFAELIVRECAEWVNHNLGLVDEEAKADLLKHFGVEL
jgi:hypothetical protein